MRAHSLLWDGGSLRLRERLRESLRSGTKPREFRERPRETPKGPRLTVTPVVVRSERPYIPREPRAGGISRTMDTRGLDGFFDTLGTVAGSLVTSAAQLALPAWVERQKAKATVKTIRETSRAYTPEAISAMELQRQYEAQQRALEQERAQGTTAPGLSWASWGLIAAGVGVLLLLSRRGK